MDAGMTAIWSEKARAYRLGKLARPGPAVVDNGHCKFEQGICIFVHISGMSDGLAIEKNRAKG